MPGAAHFADLDECRNQPKGADHERALLSGKAIIGLFDAVSKDETVDRELVRDGEHGGSDAWVVPGEKPHEWHQKERGVQSIGVVVLDEYASPIHGMGADI